MIFKISVMPLDGMPLDCENCPAARAIKRHLAPGIDVTVTHDHCTLYGRTKSHRIAFSDDVRDSIVAIDLGKEPVAPFTITLDIPLGYHA